MLLAEHIALQSWLIQQLAAVRQREMEYMLTRYQTISTQASLLCGFAVSNVVGFSDLDRDPDVPDIALHAFWMSSFVCLLASMQVILVTLYVCNWAPGLALRGPTGSMARVYNATRGERVCVNNAFVTACVAFVAQIGLQLHHTGPQ